MDIKHKDIEILSVDEALMPEPFSHEAPKLPKGKQPKNLQDRSKYGPHQGKREALRRIRQVCKDQLFMDGTSDVQDFIIEAATKEAQRVLAEDRQDSSATEEV